MTYLVALNIKSRFSRPPIGPFAFSDKHQRHVWKSQEISDIGELAEAINEALDFIRKMDQVDLIVGVYPVADSSAGDPSALPDLSAPTSVPSPQETSLFECEPLEDMATRFKKRRKIQ